ncbi:uncharacterized protein [Amphiura filiformis]|uniref:uncharacterized protein n=1 Tax=Amphiura filiformis TaxID=82378 RepID=UPI003B21C368
MHRFIPQKSAPSFVDHPAWWNKCCEKALERKNKTWRRWKAMQSPEGRLDYNKARNEYTTISRKACSLHKARVRGKMTEELQTGSKSWWWTARRLMDKGGKSEIPVLKSDGQTFITAKEKVECFASFFSDKSTITETEKSKQFPHLPPRTTTKCSSVTFWPKKVRKQLTKLDINKASGPDGIPALVLRTAAAELATPLARLFQLCFNRGHMPTQWKVADVVPCFKKGDKHSPSNYRPMIPLLPVLSKIMEKLVNKAMWKHLNDQKLISKQQFGFRAGHSTSDALTYVSQRLTNTLKNREEARVVCLDISKAFDRVWHPGRLEKLSALGFSGKLLAWLADYLSNRSMKLPEADSVELLGLTLSKDLSWNPVITKMAKTAAQRTGLLRRAAPYWVPAQRAIIYKKIDPPVVSGCPPDIEATTELGTTETVVSWIEPTATDQSSISTVQTHSPGEEFNVGITHVAYIYTDAGGTKAACTFTITVETVDTTHPSITNCTDDVTTTTELGTDGTNVFWNEPNATDLSGTPRRMGSHAPSTKFPIGLTIVTYTFFDTSNNTAICSFSVTVTIIDTTPPTVTLCPSDFDSVAGRHVTWREPDVFDLSENITIVKSHLPGLFVAEETAVEYSFTDLFGNTGFCRFTIYMSYDTIPPVISECDNIEAYAELGVLDEPVYWTRPSTTDDYGRVMLLHATHTPGERFPIGTTSVMYLFADDSYNVAYCNFSVVVNEVDTTPPTVHSCPSDMSLDIEPGTSRTPVYWMAPSVTDVSGNVSLVSQSHHPGDAFTFGRTDVVYLFKDGSNNEARCAFQVNLREVFVGNNTFIYMDILPPAIVNCPSDIHETTELGTLQLTVHWLEPSAVDLRGIATLQRATHRPMDLFPVESTTQVSYVFVDDSENIATCNFSVIVSTVDSSPPEITFCPDDISETMEIGDGNRSISWIEPRASDISGNVTLITQTHTSGDHFKPGKTRITYVFADGDGNSASCEFDIILTLVDTRSPQMLYCPSNIVTDVELGSIGTFVNWTEPSAIDNSGNVTLLAKTHSSGELFGAGKNTVTYLFVDPSNNIAPCTFQIIGDIVDSTPPEITFCPADINEVMEVGDENRSISWIQPRASDISDDVILISQTHNIGDHFKPGNTPIVYVFVDGNGNSASCDFDIIITLVDTTKPTMVYCPSDIVTDVEIGSIGTFVNWTEPAAFDKSGNVTLLAKTHSSGELFGVGKNTVTYLFVDPSNNIAACTFQVIGQTADSLPPRILSCPHDIQTSVETGTTGVPVFWDNPVVMDLSNFVGIRSTHYPGQLFSIGETVVEYTFEDQSLNFAKCKFTVRVERGNNISIYMDTAPPVIVNCPSDIHESTELGTLQLAVSWLEPSAIDLSGIATLQGASHRPMDLFPVKSSTEVSYVFVDDSENIATCNFSVIVSTVDSTPPEITFCPDGISETIEIGEENRRISWIEPRASDISGNVTLRSQTYISGDYFRPGKTRNKYIFTDGDGNSAACDFDVILTVVDSVRPKMVYCPSDIVTDVEVGASGQFVNWTEPSATDESGNITLLAKTHSPGELFGAGSTTVTYLFVDSSNNVAACAFHVIGTSVDRTPPRILSCPHDIQASTEVGTTGVSVFWDNPSVIDLSTFVEIRSTHSPGQLFSIGETVVEYTFEDQSHNIAKCNFTVTVETGNNTTIYMDTPVIVNCPSDVHKSTELGTLQLAVSWLEPSAVDLRGIATLQNATHRPGDVFPVESSTNVSYVFEDDSGNLATCNFSVIVTTVDTRKPNIQSCPPDILTDVEVGSMGASVSWTEPSATDESGTVTLLAKSHSSEEYFGVGTTSVTYLYADPSNNIASCIFQIVARSVDTTPPVIVGCPSNINTFAEVGSPGIPVFWDIPAAIDPSGTVISESSHEPGQILPVGSTFVLYTFTDSSTNIAECNFTVAIATVDTVPPDVEFCPKDVITVTELGNMGKPVYWREPITSDISGNVALSRQSHHSGDEFPLGMTDISYEYIDESNNGVWCNFSVVINTEDTTSPSIRNCPSDIVAEIIDGSVSTPVSWKEPSAMDASGNATLVVKTHQSGERFGSGTSTIMYIFADNSNNMAYCTFSVSVNLVDTLPPEVLQCPSDISTSTEIGIDRVQVFWIEPIGIDKSGRTDVIHRTHVPGQLFPMDMTQVSYVFSDEEGNRAFCNFSVTVNQKDTNPPVIAGCPSDIYKTVEIGTLATHVSWNEPIASDISGNAELLTATHKPGEEFDVGTTPVSYTYTDGSNNSATCGFRIHISESDTRAPTILFCPSNVTAEIDEGSLGAIVNWKEPIAEDVSGDVMLLIQTHSSGTFFAIGTTIVSYIFRDNANNMEKCSFSVTVSGVDKTSSKIFNCPSNIVARVEPGKDATMVTWSEPFAINLSAATKISSTHEANESFPIGSTQVVYTFEQPDGYKEYCNFTITVIKHDNATEVGKKGSQLDSSRSPSAGSGVSYAALVMSLLILIIIIGVVLVFLYIRKKTKDNDVTIEGLNMSTTSSLKSMTNF